MLESKYTTQIKLYNSYKHVFIFIYIGKKIETNIHLEEVFYLPTKKWTYGRCVFGPEVVG